MKRKKRYSAFFLTCFSFIFLWTRQAGANEHAVFVLVNCAGPGGASGFADQHKISKCLHFHQVFEWRCMLRNVFFFQWESYWLQSKDVCRKCNFFVQTVLASQLLDGTDLINSTLFCLNSYSTAKHSCWIRGQVHSSQSCYPRWWHCREELWLLGHFIGRRSRETQVK